jgi:dTMP kinase
MDGKLIVLEGANEVGKSTIASLIYTWLREGGAAAELVAFPGNRSGTLGRHIYELHHRAAGFGIESLNATSLQILHIAAHVDTIQRIILPALASGKIVILDRFWWSTIVYGRAGDVDPETLRLLIEIEKRYWEGLRPDLALLITRSEPVTPMYDGAAWNRLVRLYAEIAKSESNLHPVHHLANDGPIDESFATARELVRRAIARPGDGAA